MDAETMSGKIIEVIEQNIVEKNRGVPEELVRLVEKNILLQVMDQLWKEHIATLDYMRHTIVLRAYGQKDPLNEYKKEAFNMFSDMLDLLREKVTFLTCRAQIQNSSEEDLRLRESNTPYARQFTKVPKVWSAEMRGAGGRERKGGSFPVCEDDG